jgi:hypothetical protein
MTLLEMYGITATEYNGGTIGAKEVHGPYICIASPLALSVAQPEHRYAQITKEVENAVSSTKLKIVREFCLKRRLRQHPEYSFVKETNTKIKAERDRIETILTNILAAFYSQSPRMNMLMLVKEHNEWSIEFQPLDPQLLGFGPSEKVQWLHEAHTPFIELTAFLQTYTKESV